MVDTDYFTCIVIIECRIINRYSINITKNKIDPDYLTCNVIGCRYISAVSKDDLHTAHELTKDKIDVMKLMKESVN